MKLKGRTMGQEGAQPLRISSQDWERSSLEWTVVTTSGFCSRTQVSVPRATC